MNCPKCSSKGTILQTRITDENDMRRRYKCLGKRCKVRWTTLEKVVRTGTKQDVRGIEISATLDKKYMDLARAKLADDLRVLLGI